MEMALDSKLNVIVVAGFEAEIRWKIDVEPVIHDPELISRPHFANWYIETGPVADPIGFYNLCRVFSLSGMSLTCAVHYRMNHMHDTYHLGNYSSKLKPYLVPSAEQKD